MPKENEIAMFHLLNGQDVVARIEQVQPGDEENQGAWRVHRPLRIHEVMTEVGPMPMMLPFLSAVNTMPPLAHVTFYESHLFVAPRAVPKALEDQYVKQTTSVQIASAADLPKNNSPIITGA